MISRIYSSLIQDYLYQFPCVMISGPRQAGKSSLIELITPALDKPFEIIDLEKDEDADKLRVPSQYFSLRKNRLLIIDEIQRMPSLLKFLRELITTPGSSLRFLILGSVASQLNQLQRQLGSPLAVHLSIGPMNCMEINDVSDPLTHWLAGGFFTPMQIQDPDLRPVWYASYLRGMADRDLPLAGLREHPELVRRILPFVAESTGEELNKASITKQLDIRPEILNKVLDALENSGILRRIEACTHVIHKRVVRSPRYFFSDTGLLHYLLGIHTMEQLLVSAHAQASWSNYVINQVAGSAFPPLRLFFYQTHDGAGADIVVFKGKKPLSCISCNKSDEPVIRRGFTTAIKDFGTSINFIVKPGAYHDEPLRYNIRLTNASALCKRLEDMRQIKLRKVYIPRKIDNPEEHF